MHLDSTEDFHCKQWLFALADKEWEEDTEPGDKVHCPITNCQATAGAGCVNICMELWRCPYGPVGVSAGLVDSAGSGLVWEFGSSGLVYFPMRVQVRAAVWVWRHAKWRMMATLTSVCLDNPHSLCWKILSSSANVLSLDNLLFEYCAVSLVSVLFLQFSIKTYNLLEPHLLTVLLYSDIVGFYFGHIWFFHSCSFLRKYNFLEEMR